MLTRASIKSRLHAGAIHLSLSCVVALCALSLVFLVWYPAPLSVTQGVNRIVLILIAVDVVIGPTLTTIVFDRTKRSLPFDISVIACLQLAALLYGMHTIFVARPAVIAFNVDRFDVVMALDLDQESLGRARLAGKLGPSMGPPRIVAALLPEERSARNRILFSAAQGGPDLPQLPEWYVPYEQARATVLSRIRPLSELRDLNNLHETEWQSLLDSLKTSEDSAGYLPLRGRMRDGAVIVKRSTAEIVRIVALEPSWERHRNPPP